MQGLVGCGFPYASFVPCMDFSKLSLVSSAAEMIQVSYPYTTILHTYVWFKVLSGLRLALLKEERNFFYNGKLSLFFFCKSCCLCHLQLLLNTNTCFSFFPSSQTKSLTRLIKKSNGLLNKVNFLVFFLARNLIFVFFLLIQMLYLIFAVSHAYIEEAKSTQELAS